MRTLEQTAGEKPVHEEPKVGRLITAGSSVRDILDAIEWWAGEDFYSSRPMALWAVFTALRGPDIGGAQIHSPERQRLKRASTARVRAETLPTLARTANATVNTDGHDPSTAGQDFGEGSVHFNGHIDLYLTFREQVRKRKP